MDICAQTHIRFYAKTMQMDETGNWQDESMVSKLTSSPFNPIDPIEPCKNERKPKYGNGQVCCFASRVSQTAKIMTIKLNRFKMVPLSLFNFPMVHKCFDISFKSWLLRLSV